MRILWYLFSSLFILAVVAGLVALVGREVMLTLGVQEVRKSVLLMQKTAANPSVYLAQCQQRGAIALSEESLISTLQLRFTSSNEYVVEVLCTSFSLDPIVIETTQLPWRVSKVPGSTGIIWNEARSGVAIEFFGRSRAVILDNLGLVYENGATADLGSGPRTSCAGFGAQCCVEEMSSGVGTLVSGVTDCPRTCFQQCQTRPVILSHNTDPFIDRETREVEVLPGEPLEFNYVASGGAGSSLTAEYDFGDGERETVTGDTGMVTHSYACAEPLCEYTAQLVLRDAKGATSFASAQSIVKVKVTPEAENLGSNEDEAFFE